MSIRYKSRKVIYRVALAIIVSSLFFIGLNITAFAETVGPLPEPIVTGNSVEVCLNSRYTYHSPPGTGNDQQMSNVLWGAGRAPIIGTYRNTLVTTANATYQYDADNHALDAYSAQNSTWAFMFTYDSQLDFDTGVSYMPALLTSVSLWNSSELPVRSNPREGNVLFGVGSVTGLTSQQVAVCSLGESDPGYLPTPTTNGTDSIEAVLANLHYTDNFTQTDLTVQQISQLLWAGYGCTPHQAYNGNKGLTVPSAYADYYLTENIYTVNATGVYRYHNRNPSGNLTTRDHRLEQVKSGDIKSDLQSYVSNLPEAPFYVIICYDSAYNAEKAAEHGDDISVTQSLADFETGFVASNMLMQATALDLGAHFDTSFTSQEETDIISTANLTATNVPRVIVSLGNLGQPQSFTSYKDASHETTCDNFVDYSTEHIVYMSATGLTPGHSYRVVYYDGNDEKSVTDDLTSGASGNISSEHTFSVSTDANGLWHVIVCEPYLTPSSSYNGSWAYTIINDSFTVQESAIPEFPTAIVAIITIIASVAIYFWMRKRLVPVSAESTIKS